MTDQQAKLPIVELGKRQEMAKGLTDETEKQIMLRYGMETKVWRESNRNYFPY